MPQGFMPNIQNSGASPGPVEAVIQCILAEAFPRNCRRVTDQIVQNPNILDPGTANILHFFGGAEMVPIGAGNTLADLPRLLGYGLARRSDKKIKEEVLRELLVNNIAIRNGPKAKPLFSIEFKSVQRCVSFLTRNPSLACTLIVNIGGKTMLWLQSNRRFLDSIDLPGCRVDCSGTHLVLDRSGAITSHFVTLNKPMAVDVLEIRWDADEQRTLLPQMIKAIYGDFFRKGSRGGILPNVNALAALFSHAYPKLAFSREDLQFWAGPDEKGQWDEKSDEEVRLIVREFLEKGDWPARFGEIACDHGFLERIIKRLKYEIARKVPVNEQRVREFAINRLERARGHSMTVPELYDSYCLYAAERGWDPMSDTIFQGVICRVLVGPPFCLRKSGSITRNGENPNGFRCVREKVSGIAVGV